MQIPWHFPDFSQYSFFPWPSTKFPDFSLTFAKSGISLTFPWPLDTLFINIVFNYAITTLRWKNCHFDSGNGFLPNNTKPLPESRLSFHQLGPMILNSGQFHKSLKFADLKFDSNLPGSNELIGNWSEYRIYVSYHWFHFCSQGAVSV